MAGELAGGPAGGDVPQPDRVASVGGRKGLAVGAEGEQCEGQILRTAWCNPRCWRTGLRTAWCNPRCWRTGLQRLWTRGIPSRLRRAQYKREREKRDECRHWGHKPYPTVPAEHAAP